MSWTKKSESIRSIFINFTVFSLFTLCFAGVAMSQTPFPGTGTGPIPDRGAVGCGLPAGPNLNISFAVTGMPAGAPSNVRVSMNATHTWVGDLDARLIAPNGTEHVLFSSTGSTTPTGCGSANDLGGIYVFDNIGPATWWAQPSPFPAGTYRTTVAGDQPAPPAGTASDMNAAFAGIPATNGTWILRVNDSGGGDTGSISAATLTLTGGVAPVTQKFVDFDGDSKADFAQARDITPAGVKANDNGFFTAKSGRERAQILKDNPMPTNSAAPADHGTNIGWFISNSSNNSVTITATGQPATDFITPNDFDGDGKADIAVWRSAAAPDFAFYILDSSTNTIREELFGQTGDVSAVAGDYDGDGAADVALFRCPSTPGQCTYYYRGTAGMGETTFVPWGNGTPASIFANTGDFDGDGKNDFCIQRTNPAVPGGGQFILRRSSDSGVEFISWGLNTDFIVPGDYDGDGKSDIAVARNQSGQRTWYILERDGGVQYGVPFGLATDFITPADYDGDGKTDISVWRPDAADPNNNFFYVLRSSNSSVQTFEWGNSGDYPPANSKVQ